MPRGAVTWSLSGRADPLHLGGHQFKTKAAPHSPPLALSLLLLPSSTSLKLPCDFSSVLGARGARAEVRLLTSGKARAGRRRRG
ncbi:hypothetical protein Taro_035044, partial [Colocasia esculenta]|nr:hypothetical protein [Colocasia esculenta]